MTLPRPVTQFNVKTCIRPYETTFSGLLTIVLDEAISGEFEVAEFFRPMQVSNFHNSLQLSLYYTFISALTKLGFRIRLPMRATVCTSTGYALPEKFIQ